VCSGSPVDVLAEVRSVRTDAKQAWFAQGEPKATLGRSAALRVATANGPIDIVINSERQQVFDPRCFTEHGITLADKRLVVVKGSTHFQNGFAPLASKVVLADTPGSVSLDLAKMPFERVKRPLYPLDAGFVPTPQRLTLG
jgi:microcystin degradation protein MlrC